MYMYLCIDIHNFHRRGIHIKMYLTITKLTSNNHLLVMPPSALLALLATHEDLYVQSIVTRLAVPPRHLAGHRISFDI